MFFSTLQSKNLFLNVCVYFGLGKFCAMNKVVFNQIRQQGI